MIRQKRQAKRSKGSRGDRGEPMRSGRGDLRLAWILMPNLMPCNKKLDGGSLFRVRNLRSETEQP